MRFIQFSYLLAMGSWLLSMPSLALEDTSSTITTEVAKKNTNADLVVIAYNSYARQNDTLLSGSFSAQVNKKNNFKLTMVGAGKDLWTSDEEDDGHMRGWMYRLQAVLKEVKEEYQRRGYEDFIVLSVDALDVFVTGSKQNNTLELLMRRFLTEFAGHKIVFASQVYCCNPWELRSVARRDYDSYFAAQGYSPPSMFKHLNAGSYMGYASAILEMADEMGLWDKTYHQRQHFHSLVESQEIEHLHMRDMAVDDDEWQLAAWFFEDQAKEFPLSTLDYYQDLFAVTPTFRTQQRENGFIVFSRDHFNTMFGELPEFDAAEMDELTVCPYEYHEESKSWVNSFTGATPLVFHFAGNEWICACEVFRAEGYTNVPSKFRHNCENNYDRWRDRLNEGVLKVAGTADPDENVFLMDDADQSVLTIRAGELEKADQERFQLDGKIVGRMLQNDPYNTGGNIFDPLFAGLGAIFFCL